MARMLYQRCAYMDAGILPMDNGVPTDAAVLMLLAKVAAQPLGAKQLLHMGAAIMLNEMKQQAPAELHTLIDGAMTSMLTAPQMVSMAATTCNDPLPLHSGYRPDRHM